MVYVAGAGSKQSQKIVICLRKHLWRCNRCLSGQTGQFIPDYNHGLPGNAKSSLSRWKHIRKKIKPVGEVIFGAHPVLNALTASYRSYFYRMYVDSRQQRSPSLSLIDILNTADGKKVPIEFVSKVHLDCLSALRPHQGVCLDCSPRAIPHLALDDLFHDIELNPGSLWILLYNILDPMNFGAILRTSHFLQVDKVLVPDQNSCTLSPVVSKASAGAMEVMDMCQVSGRFRNICCLLQKWKSLGGLVIGTVASDCYLKHREVTDLQEFKATSPLLCLIGNEGHGLDEDVLALSDVLLTIKPFNAGLCSDGINPSGYYKHVADCNEFISPDVDNKESENQVPNSRCSLNTDISGNSSLSEDSNLASLHCSHDEDENFVPCVISKKPTAGNVDSMNVSVATGILLYWLKAVQSRRST